MRPPISVIELTDGIETVSVIGLEKNTGKTVVLNRLLREFRKEGVSVGLTSTGLEGEKIDQIYLNKKPEINVSKGTYFATSEKDFHNRRFSATVLDLRDYRSPLGRTVFARAETAGKVIISGPSILDYLCETVKTLKSYGCDKVLIDGSTSRLSPGAPRISDGIILATGAALSMNLEELLRKTRFAVKLISLPGAERELRNRLLPLEIGVWIDDNGVFERLSSSSLTASYSSTDTVGKTIYINGSLTSSVLLRLAEPGTRVVIRDFSCIFVDEQTLVKYERSGGRLEVVYPANLIAVTVNPYSPTGFSVKSRELVEALEKFISVPVIDVLEETAN